MSYVIQEGSHSIANAIGLCRPEVIASYPITPQTHIVERLASLIANGTLDSSYINVESEHSAISAVAGSTASGVRSYTATSSQGLALMHEVLHAVSGMRLPVVMTVANRALSAPLNIWNDHSDSMSQRDTCWIQLYGEDVQEAVDLSIQAYRIAEDKRVMLPVMVCVDGFVITHTMEPVEIPKQSEVDEFLPPFDMEYKLDSKNPTTIGAYATPDDYTEFKYQQQVAMKNSIDVIKKVNKEFKSMIGRSYGDGLLETSNGSESDSDVALIAVGSVCGTIKEALNGLNCDLIRLRTYRPFPKEELRKAVKKKNYRAIGVIDRSFSYGMGGQLCSEMRSVLDVPIKGFIAGLGGRDITIKDIRYMVSKINDLDENSPEDFEEETWVNLKLDLKSQAHIRYKPEKSNSKGVQEW